MSALIDDDDDAAVAIDIEVEIGNFGLLELKFLFLLGRILLNASLLLLKGHLFLLLLPRSGRSVRCRPGRRAIQADSGKVGSRRRGIATGETIFRIIVTATAY